MANFSKNEIKESLTIEQIFDLLNDWGGEPEITSFGIISTTICHNPPGTGSRKLYYYQNSNLFKCYTGCANDVFDIFELCIKTMQIQHNIQWNLNTAINFIGNKFGFLKTEDDFNNGLELEDWKTLERYDRIKEISLLEQQVNLKPYDDKILQNFNYSLKIKPWLNENISQEAIDFAHIGFFPGGDQITIPHYDKNNNLVGIRGRTLCQSEAEKFGKYRPLRINNITYSHPLGMNLYGFNWSKNNITNLKKAIIFESEKSILKSISYFGIDNNISVACCGSSISIFQIKLLLEAGAEEIIIAFDRQFQEIGDFEFKKLTLLLQKIYNKYNKYATISFIFDKNKLTNYKDAPIDKDKQTFLKLFEERIFL